MQSSVRRVVGAMVAIAMACGVSGCALTQWTDRYFFGTAGGPPVYEHRVVTGMVIVPFALAVDLVTFPIQAILLAIMGDDFLYTHKSRTGQPMASAKDVVTQPGLANLSADVKARLVADLDARIHQAELKGEKLPALAVTLDGHLVELDLSAEQQQALRDRVSAQGQGYAAVGAHQGPFALSR